MANSINTNPGSLTALASLRLTQRALATASKQMQTGYRVADAADDASSFSVAQGIRGNLQSSWPCRPRSPTASGSAR
jgi:flagellin